VKFGRLFDLSDSYDIKDASDKIPLFSVNTHQMGETAKNRARNGNFPQKIKVGQAPKM
jgi:hypothetical protein